MARASGFSGTYRLQLTLWAGECRMCTVTYTELMLELLASGEVPLCPLHYWGWMMWQHSHPR